jgi:predicted lipid-binding transport protein (Tim44 family)
MIIKSLIEIAFYSSLLVVRKIGSTIEENIPFVQKKKEKNSPKKAVKINLKREKDEDNQVSKQEKGLKQKESKKNTPKQEAKIMNYDLKTKKELYEVAQELDIEGRSTMNKTQLLKALKEHAKNQ